MEILHHDTHKISDWKQFSSEHAMENPKATTGLPALVSNRSAVTAEILACKSHASVSDSPNLNAYGNCQ